MIMNKTVIRNILLFIVLMLVLMVVLLLRTRSPFGNRNNSFSSEPKESITKIELLSKGSRLVLEKAGERWLVNGKSEARKSSALFIVRILTELRIKSPVSPEFFKEEITDKGIEPVKVRVFEKNRIIRTFLVYKTSSNIYGNVMKMREGAKPFIVYTPGYEGDIGSVFNLNELFWQPYTIFNLLPSEISSVTVENLDDPAASFSITRKGRYYNLSDLNNLLSGWDSSRVQRYITYFTFIQFESWDFDISAGEKKRIVSENPLFRITVNRVNQGKIVLTLWEKRSAENGMADSDRLLGKTDANDEFFVIRYFDIDPLLKKRAYFFPE